MIFFFEVFFGRVSVEDLIFMVMLMMVFVEDSGRLNMSGGVDLIVIEYKAGSSFMAFYIALPTLRWHKFDIY